jgi:hypothetical protein
LRSAALEERPARRDLRQEVKRDGGKRSARLKSLRSRSVALEAGGKSKEQRGEGRRHGAPVEYGSHFTLVR